MEIDGALDVREKNFTIALVGQPNTGKSTLFNYLTGSNQHVGNWPGKTIERKEGYFVKQGISYSIVDLPGTYSLTANSSEEKISRDFVVKSEPDLIVVVVDASQLTRSLYLAAELIPLGLPMVIALNMMDVADKKGIKIDLPEFERRTGIKTMPLTAAKGVGIDELSDEIVKSVSEKKAVEKEGFKAGENADALFCKLKEKLEFIDPENPTIDWMVYKILEDDDEVIKTTKNRVGENKFQELMTLKQGLDISIPGERYNWINNILETCVTRISSDMKVFERGFFDKIATHPFIGGLLALFVIIAGFMLSAMIAFGSVAIVHPLAVDLSSAVENFSGQNFPLITALIAEGMIPGARMIFGVSVFIFNIMLVIGFLEDIGYLPRMAYVSDILMNKIGLPGKAIMPLFMGFGCNIGSVMGSRVVESEEQRLKTILISNHIPCPGVMMTIAFIIGIFFGSAAPIVALSLFAALIFQTYVTSRVVNYTLPKGSDCGMIMELPPYHLPNWQTIWRHVWTHYKEFLHKAGTLIACLIIVVWALSYFPNGNMVDSYLASMGKWLEPFGSLMGMDWKLLTCLFIAFFSKEAALIAMAVIFGLEVSDGSLTHMMMGSMFPEGGNDAVGQFLLSAVSKPSALAFVFAILFSIPCYATIGAVYYETKSLKWTAFSSVYHTFLSFLWAFGAYRIGLIVF